MSHSSIKPRQSRGWMALLLGVCMLSVAALLLRRQRPPAWADSIGTKERILVASFRVESIPKNWSPQVFAESLAARLRAHPGVDARATSEQATEADYLVDGEITAREGGVIVAIRLRPGGQRAASWSATFWRDKLEDESLARDLALAVAEELRLPHAKRSIPRDNSR